MLKIKLFLKTRVHSKRALVHVLVAVHHSLCLVWKWEGSVMILIMCYYKLT